MLKNTTRINLLILLALITTSPVFSNSATFHLGFNADGISVGGDYEIKMDTNTGAGAYFHLVPKGDTVSGLTSLGGFVKPHISVDSFDIYLAPGFGLHLVSPVVGDSKSYLGPVLKTGVLYRLNPDILIGLEEAKFWSWFSDAGAITSEILFSVRLNL